MAIEAPDVNPTQPNAGNEIVGAQTGSESNLSNWAGPYVTDMLGKGQALSESPYEAYQGPLTAGTSDLQNAAFQGVGSLAIPTDNMGAFNPQSFTDTGVAEQYMNPYLQNSLEPQIAEAYRQAEIRRNQDNARLTSAGAYGGGRQAIMNSEASRNLLRNVTDINNVGYNTAYDKGATQFNTEQARLMAAQGQANDYGLASLQQQTDAGQIQRDITQEGYDADRQQFQDEIDFPYKQVQYQQSLLQGMPLQAQQYTYASPSTVSQFTNATDTVGQLWGEYGDDIVSGIGSLWDTFSGGGD